MREIPLEAARDAAKAINAWLSDQTRQDSPYYNAHVDVLEAITISTVSTSLWLAHLSALKTPIFTSLLFTVEPSGRARPAPGQRFLTDDLYTIQEINERVLARKGGQA